MTQPRVRPAARRDPIDAELQAVMAESLALALRTTYDDWLRAILYPLTRGEIRGKPLRTPHTSGGGRGLGRMGPRLVADVPAFAGRWSPFPGKIW